MLKKQLQNYWDWVYRPQSKAKLGKVVASPKPTKQLLDYKTASQHLWKLIQAELNRQQKRFVLDENFKTTIQAILRYFIQDSGSTLSLNKGIYLYGDVGRGKTFLMEIFSKFTRGLRLSNAFSMASAKSIVFDVASNQSLKPTQRYLRDQFCFDDLGHEESYRLYGNQINLMEEILTRRYERFVKLWELTHVTSNIPPEHLGELYGDRIASRAKELFNFVLLGGEDKRG